LQRRDVFSSVHVAQQRACSSAFGEIPLVTLPPSTIVLYLSSYHITTCNHTTHILIHEVLHVEVTQELKKELHEFVFELTQVYIDTIIRLGLMYGSDSHAGEDIQQQQGNADENQW
jgi:hypothetical protein